MFDLDREFEALLARCQISQWDEEKYRSMVLQKIRDHLESVRSRRVAVRGAGAGAHQMLHYCGDMFEVVGVFDRDPQVSAMEIEGKVYPVFPVSRMCEIPHDFILNTTHLHHEEILKEATEAGKPLVDPYDAMRREGIYYLDWRYPPYVYLPLIERKHAFKCTGRTNHKILEEIISYLLTIRDLLSAKDAIEKYISKKFTGYERYMQLKTEIELFELRLKSELAKNQNSNILLYWIDALGHDGIHDMPWLEKTSRESVYFQQSYTTGDVTRHAHRALFSGYNSVDDFDREFNKTPVCEMLKKNHYVCRGCGIWEEYVPGDFKEEALPHSRYVYQREECYSDIRAVCSILWEGYRALLSEISPVFLLLNIFMETHGPWLSPEVSWDFPNHRSSLFNSYGGEKLEEFQKNVKISRAYVDGQLRHADSLIGDGPVSIYMSDHGWNYKAKHLCRYDENLTRILMMTRGKNLPKKTYNNQLFVLTHFYSLLEGILHCVSDGDQMTEKEREKLFACALSDEIPVRGIDVYFNELVDKVIESRIPWAAWSFIGTRRLHDLYVRNRLGEEYYFRLPDKSTNRIAEEVWQKEIAHLRENTGTYFLDIEHDNRFAESRRLYEPLTPELEGE